MCWRLDFPRGRKNAVAGCLCCLFVNYFVRRTQEEEKGGKREVGRRTQPGPGPRSSSLTQALRFLPPPTTLQLIDLITTDGSL